jgi:hypothetical protein
MKFISPKTLLTIIALSITIKSFGQAHSSVGISYVFNKPYSGDYKSNNGGLELHGNLAITDKWAINPYLGYQSLKANRQYVNTSATFYNYSTITNVDLGYFGASATYFFSKELFAKAGPIVYAAGGNEDIINFGIGGTIAVGGNLYFDKHNALEITAGTDIINVSKPSGNGITPIANLKIGYNFNFGGGKITLPPHPKYNPQ